MVKLDIFSDPICPWCLIGKTQLDRALAQRPDHPFTVAWHPFQLNPDMPAEGMDRRAYLEAKFGGREKAIEVYAQIDAAARAIGLELNLGGITRTPNTRDAHRLIYWAGIEGVQSAVVDALFHAYFFEGRDIGDRDVLADVADACDLDAALIRKLMNSDNDVEEIVDQDAAARAMGLTSVPTFIVAGQHAVPGAQPTDLWLRVIDEMTGAPAPHDA